MAGVTQGFWPWPPSTPSGWPDYCGGAPGTLFLGPPAPVPLHAGGPGTSIVPGWDLAAQAVDEAASGEAPYEPDEPGEGDGTDSGEAST